MMPRINVDRSLQLEGTAEELRRINNPNIVFTVYKSNRGYSIDFLEKNIRISVIFGGASYSEHYDKPFIGENGSLPWKSNDFEIGIKDLIKPDTWYHWHGGDGWGIHAYSTPEDLDDVLNAVIDGKLKKPIDFSARRRSMTYRKKAK
jgi:hypothetical protein